MYDFTETVSKGPVYAMTLTAAVLYLFKNNVSNKYSQVRRCKSLIILPIRYRGEYSCPTFNKGFLIKQILIKFVPKIVHQLLL